MAKKKKKLGWKACMSSAKQIIYTEGFDRAQHHQVFLKMLRSRHDQDQRISLALMSLYISNYQDDFDTEIELDDLISVGNVLCPRYWKDYGRNVLYIVLRSRQVPSSWIDRISDEEPKFLRKAFAKGLEEMSKRKSIKESRILGMYTYFLDESLHDVRSELTRGLVKMGARNPEKLFYFLNEHESGAGSYRLALISQVREQLGWETK